MEDLHKKVNYLFKRLQRKYKTEVYVPSEQDCDKLKKSCWFKLLLLNINIENATYKLILAIPKTFPYEYPSIYLHREHIDLINLPHIDHNFFICTFDKSLSFSNIYKPLEVCDNIIVKACKIIKDGLTGKNYKDYEEEFLAYWTNNNCDANVLSIVKPANKVKDICIFDIRKLNFKGYKYLLADSLSDGTDWLSNADIMRSDIVINHDYGVFFPINTATFSVIPKINKEILTFLQGNKLKELFNHLNNKKRPTLVLCNYKNGMFAFELQEYYDNVRKGTESLKRKHQKGFRHGKQVTSMELTGFAKDNKIKRYDVDRFDKERLFERGGEGLKVNQQYKINILGCGSIGSFLLEKLVQVGFNSFNLVDNDIFCIENLARHVCDISDLGFRKVEALKNKMFKRYPLLKITTMYENIVSLALNSIETFNSCDLNIACVGDYNTEICLTKLLENKIIQKPILILWVESYLKAGHFVYINPNDVISFEELHYFESNNLVYKYSVNPISNQDKKQEAGCQSVYIPYGTLSISSFLNNVVYLIQEIASKKITQSCIYRWQKESSIIDSKMEKLL